MPKIKCYDKYNKHHLIINLGGNDRNDDEIDIWSFSSNYSKSSSGIIFEIDFDYYKAHPEESAEDPRPSRWSDLEQFELIK